jgi:hypothetical protein
MWSVVRDCVVVRSRLCVNLYSYMLSSVTWSCADWFKIVDVLLVNILYNNIYLNVHYIYLLINTIYAMYTLGACHTQQASLVIMSPYVYHGETYCFTPFFLSVRPSVRLSVCLDVILFSTQLLLHFSTDLDETWYKARWWCLDVHVVLQELWPFTLILSNRHILFLLSYRSLLWYTCSSDPLTKIMYHDI